MDTTTIIISAVFGTLFMGLLVWALKGYIFERTKRTRASNNYITAGELSGWCKDEHEQVENKLTMKIEHVHELIEKDLEHGSKRFEKIDKRLDETQKTLIDMDKVVVLIAQERGIEVKREGS